MTRDDTCPTHPRGSLHALGFHRWILLVALWWTGICEWPHLAGAVRPLVIGPRPAVFYVANHGWHSGIILPRAAIAPGAWPPGVVEHDFAGCAYLDLGWGDRNFYPAKHPGVQMALRAAFAREPGVLHIAGLNPPLASAQNWSTLLAVPCTRAELDRLCRELGRSFETDAHGRVARMGPGLYGARSGFYPAHGHYWVGDNCNTWTARELRAGGLDTRVHGFAALTSGEVIGQVRRLTRERAEESSANGPPAAAH